MATIIYMAGAALVGVVIGGICVYLSIRDEWRSENEFLNAQIERKNAEIIALRSTLEYKETPRCYELTDAQIAAFFRGESIENDYFKPF